MTDEPQPSLFPTTSTALRKHNRHNGIPRSRSRPRESTGVSLHHPSGRIRRGPSTIPSTRVKRRKLQEHGIKSSAFGTRHHLPGSPRHQTSESSPCMVLVFNTNKSALKTLPTSLEPLNSSKHHARNLKNNSHPISTHSARSRPRSLSMSSTNLIELPLTRP